MTDEPITLKEARCRKAEQGAGARATLDGDIIMPGGSLDDINFKPGEPVEETKEETIARLCRLDPIEYDRVRVAQAEALGIRATTLDKVVAGARGDGSSEDTMFAEVAPAATAVAGAEVLEEVSAIFTRHLILPAGAADAMALWVFHAHLHDTAEISPILALTSPTPECGKTTALNLIGALVPKPLASSNITAAAVFRGIEKWRPTLLVDEADSFLKDNDELRGVLNSGHYRRTAFVIRVTGDNLEPARFTTWAPKVIALIGKLPPTLASRSIHIEMRRMAPGETAEPVRLERLDFNSVVAAVARWALDHDLALRDAEPDMPGSLFGRRADNWRSLLAIADLAGGRWPARARAAAETLTAQGSEQTIGILLLEDIKMIFAELVEDRISSAALVEKLVDIETRSWGEWTRGKAITVRQLARLLAPFGIGPAKIRIGTTTLQGYRLEAFEDNFARYLSIDPEHRNKPQKPAENSHIRSGTHIDPVPDEKPLKPAVTLECSGVPDETGQETELDGDLEERAAIQEFDGEGGTA